MVRESNVPELLERNNAPDTVAYCWKYPTGARMEEQRLLINDQVLVKAKAAWHDSGRNRDIVRYILFAISSTRAVISIYVVC